MSLRKHKTQSLSLFFLWGVCLVFLTHCGNSSSTVSSSTSVTLPGACVSQQSTRLTSCTQVPTPAGEQGKNILPVHVGGYFNEPYVSLQICAPGSSNCATIDYLLVDSGSSGLRIFNSALPPSLASALPSVTNAGGSLEYANCTLYGDRSVHWGPVKSADITLGGQVAASVPMQVIDWTYGDSGTQCLGNLSAYESVTGIQDTASSFFNGILGLNFLTKDCGSYCETNYSLNYYGCTGTNCTFTTIPKAKQISNPIAFLTYDYNGFVIDLPAPAYPGYTSSLPDGSIRFGIGTQPNNTPDANVVALQVDTTNVNSGCPLGIQTYFEGKTMCSFLDSGSNPYLFPSTSMPKDLSNNFIPLQRTLFQAVNIDISGVCSIVSFTIGNPYSMSLGSNVFSEWGVDNSSGGLLQNMFDFGLPFFLGKKVYVGLKDTCSSLGSNLYWGY